MNAFWSLRACIEVAMFFVVTENKVQETFRELLCFCFIQMKPDVEIYFSDITDTMKKLIKVILQPLLL